MHILKSQTLKDEDLLKMALALSTGSSEKLLHWEFGPIMEMRYEARAKNYLFSDGPVPLHWDGAFHQEPSKLLFYCTESEGRGGETLFVNTEEIWKDLSETEKEVCLKARLTYRTQKIAHYGGEIKVPLVQEHPHTGAAILRMAERVETELNPVELEIYGVENAEEFYQFMRAKLYEDKYLYEHSWEKGDVIICDNFTYLHGRRALSGNLKRSFKRIQIL